MKEVNYKEKINEFALKLTKSWKGKYLRFPYKTEYSKIFPNNYPFGFIKVIDIILGGKNNEPTIIYKDIDAETQEEGRTQRLKLNNFIYGKWVIMNKKELRNELVLSKL